MKSRSCDLLAAKGLLHHEDKFEAVINSFKSEDHHVYQEESVPFDVTKKPSARDIVKSTVLSCPREVEVPPAERSY